MQINFKSFVYPIIILLLIISNSIFYINYRKDINSIQILNQKINESEKENQELKNRPPFGWNEYIDNNYSFKIWYPKTFIYFDQASKVEIEKWGDPQNPYKILFLLADIHDEGIPIRMANISINNSNLDIEEYIKKDIGENNLDQQIIKTRNNGIDLYKVETPGETLSYYIKRDNLVFVLNPDDFLLSSGVPRINSPEDDKKVFEQMVKSFRFTE